MSDQLLSSQDLQDLLHLPAALRFLRILVLNAKPAYANRLNVVELMVWLADQQGELDGSIRKSAGSSHRFPASSGEAP